MTSPGTQCALFESAELIPIEQQGANVLPGKLETHLVVECRGKKEDAELELKCAAAFAMAPGQAAGRQREGRDFEEVGLMIYPPQKAKSPDGPTEAVAPTRNPRSTWARNLSELCGQCRP